MIMLYKSLLDIAIVTLGYSILHQ